MQEKKYTHPDFLLSEQNRQLKAIVKLQKIKIEQLRTHIVEITENMKGSKLIKIEPTSQKLKDAIANSANAINFKTNGKALELVEALD